jgi:hypothetical protein
MTHDGLLLLPAGSGLLWLPLSGAVGGVPPADASVYALAPAGVTKVLNLTNNPPGQAFVVAVSADDS